MTLAAIQEWFPWLKLIGLVVTFAALVFVAWWALYADRPRGRRRCPNCWYDLTYSPGMTCGECGFVAGHESDFARTKRKRGIALLAMLGCAAIGVYLIDDANTRGWMSVPPTRVLIFALPHVGESNTAVSNELFRRMRSDEMSDGQWLALLGRCIEGEGSVVPPTDEWLESRYGQLADNCGVYLRRSEDEEIRERAAQILLDVAVLKPPDVTLSTRSIWPAGVSPVVDVEASDWWPGQTHMRIRSQPRLPDVEPIVHVRHDNPIQTRSYSLYLPPLEPGVHEVEFELSFDRRAADGDEWLPAGSKLLTLDLDVSAGSEAKLEPVSGPGMDNAITRVLGQGLVKWERGNLPVRVGLDIRPTYRPQFDQTAVAIRIDVLRNGTVARQLDIWWVGGTGRIDRQYAWEVPMWNDALLGAPNQPGDRWSLRARGLPELAYRVENVSRYWAGDVTIPIGVRHRKGRSPSRGWMRESAQAP